MASHRNEPSTKRKLKKTRRFSLRNLISTLLLAFALAVLFYPIVVNYLVSRQNVQSVTNYSDAVSSLGKTKAEKMLADAKLYNAKLYNEYIYDASQGIKWQGNIPSYDQTLNVEKNGMMGYISIPQIKVENVPIYHGDSEATLAVGVGHIQQTSLPIGGNNTHTVLVAHSGRVNDTLFTDLDTLKIGDVFYINVLSEKLRYQIINIKIVEPADVSDLSIEKGQDLATLVTCYPTGINNKRLLVTGKRVALDEKIPQANITRNYFGYNFWVFTGSSLLALLALGWILYWLLWAKFRLYQAAFMEVKTPSLTDMWQTGDFGSGFYLTNSKKLAKRWASGLLAGLESNEVKPVLNVYRLKKRRQLTRWIFKSKSENWRNYIEERKGDEDNRHELIMGPLPNEDYGLIKKIIQYTLKSKTALDHLKYIKTIPLKRSKK
jgi:sortase A